jgi:hypothetical protein
MRLTARTPYVPDMTLTRTLDRQWLLVIAGIVRVRREGEDVGDVAASLYEPTIGTTGDGSGTGRLVLDCAGTMLQEV